MPGGERDARRPEPLHYDRGMSGARWVVLDVGETLVDETRVFRTWAEIFGLPEFTLMAVLGCLDRPSSGHYFFEGTDVAGLSEPERARLRSERLGFVFQSFNLLSRTSAIENVALPLFYAASGPASAASRTARA